MLRLAAKPKIFGIARGAVDPPLITTNGPRNLRDARAGRGRMVSQEVGRRPRRGSCRCSPSQRQIRVSRHRHKRASETDWRKISKIDKAWKTNAVRVFRRQLA